MLPVFHVDVAYVAMAIHVCCKCIVLNIKCVLSGCYIYFTHILQVFHLDAVYVSHIYYKCFIWMMHMFHTYVVSVSYVLQ
jgi:hypothetical protein